MTTAVFDDFPVPVSTLIQYYEKGAKVTVGGIKHIQQT